MTVELKGQGKLASGLRYFEGILGFSEGSRQTGRLVVVANRLPVVVSKNGNGEPQIKPGSGGLITALTPVLRRTHGLWIGWPGMCGELSLDGQLPRAGKELGCVFEPVQLSEDEMKNYYLGFSNETLWPLFHGLHSRCRFEPTYWGCYQAVNRKFARAIAENSSRDDYIWVHDYHLLLAARELRRIGLTQPVAFFLHIPFPPPEIFEKLPWSASVLNAMLEYDLIGFQTIQDRDNFLQCAEYLVKGPRLNSGGLVSIVVPGGHRTRIGVFPISIDCADFASAAAQEPVTEKVAELRRANEGQKIILGIDRLDYSKGIPYRLLALENALERFGDLRKKVTLIQVVVPSREGIAEYQRLKGEIEGLVSRINSRFAGPGWIPVQYLFRSLEKSELVAHYRAADIALITPLKDGMNLVAKEYCVSNIDENGVLILSKFAGAARQLGKNALLINPYDIQGVATAIKKAFSMGTGERQARMRRLRKLIRRRDIHWWSGLFFRRAGWLVDCHR